MGTLPKIPRAEARTVRKLLGMTIGIGGVAFGLTALFLSMRRVTDIGGSCGSSTTCPGGLGWLLPVSVLVLLICGGLYIGANFDGGPDLTGLFWSGLFGPLGWNFLEYGFTKGDVGWGMVVTGLLFWAMALPPLVAQLGRRHLLRFVWGGPPTGARTGREKVRQAAPKGLAPLLPARYRTTPRRAPGPDRPPPVAPLGDDLVSRLERLAHLHRTGVLDRTQYERAKERILRGGT